MLGTGCGLATSVFSDKSGSAIAKAGWLAGFLWVAGVGSRIAFSLYTEHGGGPAVGRFSVAHHITSAEAWVACLVLMGVMEVLSRTTVLAFRLHSLRQSEQKTSSAVRQPVPAAAMIDLDGRWS